MSEDIKPEFVRGENSFKGFSPTSLHLFERDREKFYLEKIARYRIPGMVQTLAMSLGSATDSRIKAYLYEQLAGGKKDDRYTYTAMFEESVSPGNRDWAHLHSKIVFDAYMECGALNDLLLDLNRSIIMPRFEFMLFKELVIGKMKVNICGKPDCYAVLDTEVSLVADWKVNGYCSTKGASPKKGFIKCRPGIDRCHKDAVIKPHKGIDINIAHNMEDIDKTYADQLTMYAWSLGEPYCGDFVVQIEQFACTPLAFAHTHPDYQATIKCVTLRSLVGPSYQKKLLDRLVSAQHIIDSGWFFRDLSEEDSKIKQEQLEEIAMNTAITLSKGDDNDLYFMENVR